MRHVTSHATEVQGQRSRVISSHTRSHISLSTDGVPPLMKVQTIFLRHCEAWYLAEKHDVHWVAGAGVHDIFMYITIHCTYISVDVTSIHSILGDFGSDSGAVYILHFPIVTGDGDRVVSK